MIGLVSTLESELQEVSANIHITLSNTQGIKYVAENYGDPFQHPAEDKYALKIVQDEPYYEFILNCLTEEQKENLEVLSQDWFDQ